MKVFPTLAAARCFALMYENETVFQTVCNANEPLRAAVDAGREHGLHDIDDGSDDYAALVDVLEVLFCQQDMLEGADSNWYER